MATYNGWITNTAEEYHASPGVGSSTLKALLQYTPMKARYSRHEPSASQEWGTKVHAYLLENAPVCVMPEGMRRNTNAFKEWTVASEGMIISEREHASLLKMKENIGDLFTGGVAEQSGYDEVSEVKCRIRPDYRTKDTIYDLKTASDISDRAIEQCIFGSYNYKFQASFYVMVANYIDGVTYDFKWVFVDSKWPHEVRIVQVPEIILWDQECGEVHIALELYRECSRRNEWPTYKKEPLILDYPSWYKR